MIAVAGALATFYGEGERTCAHAVAVPLLVLAIHRVVTVGSAP